MSVLVVSYPHVAHEHLEWIRDALRRSDGLRHSVLPPHFTIVFPTASVAEPDLLAHLETSLSGWARIPFVLRGSLVVKDPSSSYTYVFLVPDEGFSGIVRLHDRAYTGLLASELRLDIPFIPHITIGYAEDPWACKRIADSLNQQGFEVPGVIDSLAIVRKDDNDVRTVGTIRLR